MRDDLLWHAAFAGCVSAIIVALTAGGAASITDATAWVTRELQTASVFFVQSTTSAEIQHTYTSAPAARRSAQKVKILIVPGHQPTAGGTEFGGVEERDVVVDIADTLASLLARNLHYEVMVARNKVTWNPILQTYFDANVPEILTFIQAQKSLMETYIARGAVREKTDKVYHNAASAQGALQLYGINKWANENNFDITIHLHLNDDSERPEWAIGKYDGFAVYVPDHQYSNAEASKSIGEAIAVRLNEYHATSTLPKESVGVVEDQDLIAIGSNNTSNNASILIEYGYIYEPQFQDAAVRTIAVNDYAYQTYIGLQDFFNDPVTSTYASAALPFDWTNVTAAPNDRGPGIYALQSALHRLGYYPPVGKTFSECPISGLAGDCTRTALKAFQNAHQLETTGEVGQQTRALLEASIVAL